MDCRKVEEKERLIKKSSSRRKEKVLLPNFSKPQKQDVRVTGGLERELYAERLLEVVVGRYPLSVGLK